jgi:glyoxylase-like metal-dependent hydrolase (beta-lactamase superfamily II)/rhodanese-related sulfurtransferase
MIFEQLNSGACKTYLVGSESTREAILVDPVLENVDTYLARIRAERLRLVAVLDTHVHADHISGAAAIRDRTGADYIMHELSTAQCANRRVRDGDRITIGDVTLELVHTPGHTQDSLTVRLPDRILTGDFLFIGEGGAGRTDLPGGDAGEHWDALQKLNDMPDALWVFPAHDYHGKSQSTLGDERRTNPRLQPRRRDDYVRWLESVRLGPAAWMADVIKANYACAMDPRAAWIPVDQPSCEIKGTAGNVNADLVRTIAADELAALLGADPPPVLLDVRQPEELAGELPTLPGARSIPLGELSHRLGELAGLEGRTVVTICRSGGRSSTAAAILGVAGFSDVRSLAGGLRGWRDAVSGSPGNRPAAASSRA